jgi:hypothetical protein
VGMSVSAGDDAGDTKREQALEASRALVAMAEDSAVPLSTLADKALELAMLILDRSVNQEHCPPILTLIVNPNRHRCLASSRPRPQLVVIPARPDKGQAETLS